MPSHRRPSPLLVLALLLSLAAHAAAGLLFTDWRRIPFEPPRPLVVVLEEPPPAQSPPPRVEPPPPRVEPPRVEPPRPRVERNRPKPGPTVPIEPDPPPPRASPSEIAADRAEPAPTAVTPAPEIAPAPTVVAKPPAMAAPPPRLEPVEPPRFNVAYLNNPPPAYPAIARRLGLEGVVVLRVDVTAGGTPREITVAKSSGAPVLDEAAVRAVRGWTFVPARRGDTPIAHVVDVPIRFELRN